jgi:hypothetical protein
LPLSLILLGGPDWSFTSVLVRGIIFVKTLSLRDERKFRSL